MIEHDLIKIMGQKKIQYMEKFFEVSNVEEDDDQENLVQACNLEIRLEGGPPKSFQKEN